jgi:ubiquitin-protein ligase
MHPRARRLTADAEQMRTEFAGHPEIEVEALGWEPPERYRVTFHLTGVKPDEHSGQPVVAEHHQALIKLPAAYPREKPYCTMDTPVFHPNFGANVGDEICIGDYWTPARTLVDIVVKIGEMLQFQTYNVRSPLNAIAARWVAENEDVFPIGNVALYQAEPEISLTADSDRLEVDRDVEAVAEDGQDEAPGGDEQ